MIDDTISQLYLAIRNRILTSLIKTIPQFSTDGFIVNSDTCRDFYTNGLVGKVYILGNILDAYTLLSQKIDPSTQEKCFFIKEIVKLFEDPIELEFIDSPCILNSGYLLNLHSALGVTQCPTTRASITTRLVNDDVPDLIRDLCELLNTVIKDAQTAIDNNSFELKCAYTMCGLSQYVDLYINEFSEMSIGDLIQFISHSKDLPLIEWLVCENTFLFSNEFPNETQLAKLHEANQPHLDRLVTILIEKNAILSISKMKQYRYNLCFLSSEHGFTSVTIAMTARHFDLLKILLTASTSPSDGVAEQAGRWAALNNIELFQLFDKSGYCQLTTHPDLITYLFHIPYDQLEQNHRDILLSYAARHLHLLAPKKAFELFFKNSDDIQQAIIKEIIDPDLLLAFIENIKNRSQLPYFIDRFNKLYLKDISLNNKLLHFFFQSLNAENAAFIIENIRPNILENINLFLDLLQTLPESTYPTYCAQINNDLFTLNAMLRCKTQNIVETLFAMIQNFDQLIHLGPPLQLTTCITRAIDSLTLTNRDQVLTVEVDGIDYLGLFFSKAENISTLIPRNSLQHRRILAFYFIQMNQTDHLNNLLSDDFPIIEPDQLPTYTIVPNFTNTALTHFAIASNHLDCLHILFDKGFHFNLDNLLSSQIFLNSLATALTNNREPDLQQQKLQLLFFALKTYLTPNRETALSQFAKLLNRAESAIEIKNLFTLMSMHLHDCEFLWERKGKFKRSFLGYEYDNHKISKSYTKLLHLFKYKLAIFDLQQRFSQENPSDALYHEFKNADPLSSSAHLMNAFLMRPRFFKLPNTMKRLDKANSDNVLVHINYFQEKTDKLMEKMTIA